MDTFLKTKIEFALDEFIVYDIHLTVGNLVDALEKQGLKITECEGKI